MLVLLYIFTSILVLDFLFGREIRVCGFILKLVAQVTKTTSGDHVSNREVKFFDMSTH